MTTMTLPPASSAPPLDLSNEDLYPIREVSRLTGVNSVTLRAWERRYGLLVPHRTPSGHRLYSMADIERVRSVMSWIDRGVAVSKVASIIDRQVKPAAVSEPVIEVGVAAAQVAAADLQSWQTRLIEAVNAFDLRGLDLIYGQVQGDFPMSVMFDDVLLPVWRRFLDSGEGSGLSGQWAFLDAYLRGRLFQRLSYRRSGYSCVMLAGLPGPQKELEMLVAAAFIAAAEVDVVYLPAVPSISELTDMAQRCGCDAIALYGGRTIEDDLLKSLRRMEQALECPVAVVGALCEVQPAELLRAGMVLLGEPAEGLSAKMRLLLAGRLEE
ncbi:MerR family transcriptional regulator [Halopseudomonas pelagia]|uniref:Helix-turn-helix-type transcriptional regulator n=2 Tax=Halopseudomonas pelagia TaxID=553151 RepID=A0AA91Z7A3_9GAMM|nr:helix-turn-helix-type transcriptional regulator [Halopseudomonas pelagia]QFY55858.1 MerR family transcriptional regulator [Halopseudomonas pelagia]